MKKDGHFQNTVLFEKKGRKGKLPGFWVRVLVVFGCGIVFAAFLYALLRSPWPDTSSISVEGAELVSHDAVIAAVEANTIGRSTLASLLGPGNIIFWLFADPHPALARFPQLRNVEVRTALWQKRVTITVDERRVGSVLCKTTLEECYGLDQDGIIFTRSPEVHGALILKFEDASTSSVVLGNPYLRDPQWLQNVKDTLAIMKEQGFVPKVVQVNREPLEEWQAIFPSSPAFYFSLHFVPENLSAILKDIGDRTDIKNLSYFDFRVPNRIYYK